MIVFTLYFLYLGILIRPLVGMNSYENLDKLLKPASGESKEATTMNTLLIHDTNVSQNNSFIPHRNNTRKSLPNDNIIIKLETMMFLKDRAYHVPPKIHVIRASLPFIRKYQIVFADMTQQGSENKKTIKRKKYSVTDEGKTISAKRKALRENLKKKH